MAWMKPVMMAALVLPAVAVAQGRPVAEIGTSLGVTVTRDGGTSVTHLALPGPGMRARPTLYASLFRGRMLVEPQAAVDVLAGEGETVTVARLGGQLGYLLRGAAENSPFVAATLASFSVSSDAVSNSDFALGAKVGYRSVIGTSFAVRLEAGYLRWFLEGDRKVSEFSFGLSFGGVVRRAD